MKITESYIKGLYVVEPEIWKDKRGYFFESFREDIFTKAIGEEIKFVQENQSYSTFGVIRGLHFQKPPHSQAKLIRVVRGKAIDIAVDIRHNSPTFGRYFEIELSEENQKQIFIPRGFAHGFSVLTPEVILQYKCDNYYNKESEEVIAWNDKDINIDWRISEKEAIISEKDLKNISLKDLPQYFVFNEKK